jgi:hypothetical protein
MSGGNSVVESLPSKQMVAGSSPVPRSSARSSENVGHRAAPGPPAGPGPDEQLDRGNGREALMRG